ncbi:hypothetical protein VCHA53O466_140022 [Vibrio chagasii]|nr:hypothetical protein VCHA53O466_140022 [Vibrio chagasii]
MAERKQYSVNGIISRLNHAPSIKGVISILMIENSTAIFSVNYSGVVERDGVGVLDLVASNVGDSVSFMCSESLLSSGKVCHSIIIDSYTNCTVSCEHTELLPEVG